MRKEGDPVQQSDTRQFLLGVFKYSKFPGVRITTLKIYYIKTLLQSTSDLFHKKEFYSLRVYGRIPVYVV